MATHNITVAPSAWTVIRASAPNSNDPAASTVGTASYTETGTSSIILMRFDLPDSALGYNVKTISVHARFAATLYGVGFGKILAYLIPDADGLDLASVTWATRPNMEARGPISSTSTTEGVLTIPGAAFSGSHGLVIGVAPYETELYTPRGGNMYLELSLEEPVYTPYIWALGDLTEGPERAHYITWGLSAKPAPVVMPRQTSAVLTYTPAGGESVTVALDGDTRSYLLPAGTLKVGANTIGVAMHYADGVTRTASATVTYEPMELASITPAGGFVDNSAPAVFAWSFRRSNGHPALGDGQYMPVEISSALLEWRDGDGGDVTSQPVGGSDYTVPAGTLPETSNLLWRLTHVETLGGDYLAATGWYTVTTIEPRSNAVNLTPVNTVETGETVTYAWQHIISTGTAPTGYRLETRLASTEAWTVLRDVHDSSDTSAEIPAAEQPAGRTVWRVATYNTDSLLGEYSVPTEFVLYAPPPAPVIAITRLAPVYAIRWTSVGQEAREISVDGSTADRAFGSDTTYTSSVPLPDGDHRVGVRVQNAYGIWSTWSCVDFTVANSAPSVSLQLDVSVSDTSNVLTLTADVADAILYRSGVPIAEITPDSPYIDRLPIGVNAYYACYISSDGNYAVSNTVSVETRISHIVLDDMRTGSSLTLKYADGNVRRLDTSSAYDVSYVHLSGVELPVAEVGEALSRSYELACAFPPMLAGDAASLEAMLGHEICVRDFRGNKIFAVLSSLEKRDHIKYVAYSTRLTAIDHREGCDA